MSSGGGLNGGGYQPVPDSPEDHPLELEQGQRQEPERRQGAATNIIATNGVTPEDLKYAIGSFTAVAAPVALTMCIAALVAVTVSTEYSAATQEASMGAYEIFQGANGDSNPMKLGKSLANAVVIVLFIAAATFMIVLLYRYRCMSCLTGYMMFSSATLLGVMGGSFLYTALDKWSIPCDYITFVFVLWNFAAVGVLSIFYQKGLPRIFTQGYLVATSVIMAWQLSRIDEWTGWSLLVVLALYDLCAVLSPYGPLNALVGLMQEYDDPMPGLVYEAHLSHAPPLLESQIQSSDGQNQAEDDDDDAKTIKLGLGDFCFYSVLVAKAAIYSFTAFLVCFLVIICGLCGTLILLGIYRMALPALPISITLGVLFYILTRWAIQPYMEELMSLHVYV